MSNRGSRPEPVETDLAEPPGGLQLEQELSMDHELEEEEDLSLCLDLKYSTRDFSCSWVCSMRSVSLLNNLGQYKHLNSTSAIPL